MTHARTMHGTGWRATWRAALLALVALCLFGSTVGAAGAMQDDGNLFSQNARTDFANRSAQIERDTGKSLVVRTVPNLGGKDISAQADAVFSSLNINGVLIYLAKAEKKTTIKVGSSTRQAISTQEEGQIRDQIDASFGRGDFDGGLLNATDRIGRDLRAVFSNTNANRGASNQPATTGTVAAAKKSGGIGFGALLLILILIVAIVAVLMSILRRRGPSGGNSGGYGGSYGPATGPVDAGYNPNYGPNYGPQQRGGGFGSSVAGGAVGGFGGAILGNAVYDHFRDGERNHDRSNDQYGGNNGPNQDANNDQGRVDDSYQDTGSWGGDSGGGDPGVGGWGDSGGGDSGSDSGGGGDTGSN